MRGVRGVRALASFTQNGDFLISKCFVRNSFSGPPAGRGRGAGLVFSPRPIGAPAEAPRDESIGSNQDSAENGGEENSSGRGGAATSANVQDRDRDAGRGRGIVGPGASVISSVGTTRSDDAQADSPPGSSRGRGLSVAPPGSIGRGRGSSIPGLLGAVGENEQQQQDASISDNLLNDLDNVNAAVRVEAAQQVPPRRYVPLQLGKPLQGRGRGEVDEIGQRTLGAATEDLGQEVQLKSTPVLNAQEARQRAMAILEEGIDREMKRAAGVEKFADANEYSTGRLTLGVDTEAAAADLESKSRSVLTAQEARERAMFILEEGIERNVAAERERRRKGGVERFADVDEYFTDRLKRAPGQAPALAQGSTKGKERSRRINRASRSETEQDLDSSVQAQLTPEQEEKLRQLDEADTFMEKLHSLFLVQFEPEYAMEEFGTNPDIEERPPLSLEEFLQNLKPMFLRDSAEVSEEQKWQEAVQRSLAEAPQLEKLVESYAGPGRMTARQQIQKLEGIYDKLPKTSPPEVSAFTQRALLTIQNNPGMTIQQKREINEQYYIRVLVAVTFPEGREEV